eukprot:scaffold10661_cov50-Attheya_sp.AAC.1
MSAKAKENAKKKKKKAVPKKKQKKNPTTEDITASSSSTTTPKKRKAVSKSNDNTNVPVTKIVKKNKTTDASDDEDIKVRVEESIVVRDKKGIDKYVKRNNKLDDITIIHEDHYRKTINYLLNKKTTVEKELSKTRENQTVDMKDKELKILNVKMHAWAMKNAKITEKTSVAKRIKKEFLKGPWGEEFITKFEEPLNFKNLWWGKTEYIVLGTASMTALKNTRNAMSKRIIDTTGNANMDRS